MHGENLKLIGLFYLLYQVQFSRTLRLCFSELFIKGSMTHPTYIESQRLFWWQWKRSQHENDYLLNIYCQDYAGKDFHLLTIFKKNRKGTIFFTLIMPAEFHYTLSGIYEILHNSGLLSPNTPYQLLQRPTQLK